MNQHSESQLLENVVWALKRGLGGDIADRIFTEPSTKPMAEKKNIGAPHYIEAWIGNETRSPWADVNDKLKADVMITITRHNSSKKSIYDLRHDVINALDENRNLNRPNGDIIVLGNWSDEATFDRRAEYETCKITIRVTAVVPARF